MAPKPKILFALIEESNRITAQVKGLSVQYQLSLAEMGGERRVKLSFLADFDAIELNGEWELILNYAAAENLQCKLIAFLETNRPPEAKPYQ